MQQLRTTKTATVNPCSTIPTFIEAGQLDDHALAADLATPFELNAVGNFGN